MNCPVCSKAMVTQKIDQIELDTCQDCKGVWFDQDELRQAKDQADTDLNWLDFELWQHEDQFHITSKPIACPKCQADMVAVQYNDTGVEVNYCSGCRGTWLEEEKFGKIIDALTNELTTKSLSGYFKATLEEGKEIVVGPESFFSEWKDFTTVLRLFEYRFFVENPRLQATVISIQKANPFR